MGEGGNQFSNLKLKRSNEYSHVNENTGLSFESQEITHKINHVNWWDSSKVKKFWEHSQEFV